MNLPVVPYIGTWIETMIGANAQRQANVVPYIGTWIETYWHLNRIFEDKVVPYIGTWIETSGISSMIAAPTCRTLYRYVD